MIPALPEALDSILDISHYFGIMPLSQIIPVIFHPTIKSRSGLRHPSFPSLE